MKTGLRINVLGALFVTLLMTAGAPESPVADAAQSGNVETVRVLLRQGADVNAAQGDGMSALHWASMTGNSEMAGILLYAGANPESTTRLGGFTALHLASKAGYEGVVRVLVEGGADLAAVTGTGVTALHYAGASGRAEAVSVLLAHGAEVDVREGTNELTPLMWATASNRLRAMEVLLAGGADPSLTSRTVDYAALASLDNPDRQRRERLVVAQRALDEGVDAPPSAAGRGGRGGPPPAQAAPQRGRGQQPAQVAQEAAEEEAQGDEEATSEEETADERAAEDEGDDEDEAETSRESDEDDPLITQAPGQQAVAGGRGGGGGAPGAPRPLSYDQLVGLEGGFTALHFASRDGLADVAKLLLANGADVSQGTAGDGTSPLLMATINGEFDLAMAYLEHGADPNQVAEDGVAPLFQVLNRRWGPKAGYPQPAAFRQQETDYLDMMRALLDAGADVDYGTGRHVWYTSFNFDQLGVNFTGATAFWRAAYALDLAGMRLLVSYGADGTIPSSKAPSRRFVFQPSGTAEVDPSGLDPVPDGGPGVYPIHAASGVGYGQGFASNSHTHAPGSWLPAIQYLVEEHGADVNARDSNGYSAVHHAAARGDNEVIDYLVSQGADVTVVSRRGETTVDMANGPRQRIQPFPETIALLESLGAINNHNCQSCE
jgi:ankyrin repeat protein